MVDVSLRNLREILKRDERAVTEMRDMLWIAKGTLFILSTFFDERSYCGKRSCTNCIAGTAERVVEYKWDKPTHVCVFCASEISRQTHFLALLKAHSEIKGSALSVPMPSNNDAWFHILLVRENARERRRRKTWKM
jgi:hypothetical protein